MSLPQANPRECVRAIDAEIESLEGSIRVLRRRRNALAPISSLPPEVFIAIFSLLCLPGIPSPGLARRLGNPDARLRVTQVCHQWREIVLNQPLLWSHVDFTTLSLADITEVLVRSKSLPLRLEFLIEEGNDFRFSIFQRELQAHFPRICHLNISAKPSHLLHILEKIVSPAPTLEYLSLSSLGEILNPVDLPIPDTLFDGSAPRLSHLELRNCDISWNSALLKGLEHLEILKPSVNARPELSVWLGTLDQMTQLKTLVLHSASPVAPPFPFDVERTVTLPSLIRLDISSSPGDCALALAHLDLPALTSLCLTVIYHLPNYMDVLKLFPYVVQHSHGIQDAQPLQSMHIYSERSVLGILAWPVPDIAVEVHDTPPLFGATLPPRVALAFWCKDSSESQTLLAMEMGLLPMDGLVTLSVKGISDMQHWQIWLYHASCKWPLLHRVRLAPTAERGFFQLLLEDNRGTENPLFPSLTELALVDIELNAARKLSLCDLLMKRVEQGVPLETLDLRKCRLNLDRRRGDPDAVQLFSEVVVNVLGPK